MVLIFLGYETTHKVNNLILQGSFENIEPRHKASSPKKKRSCRSFLPIVSETCLQYCQKKRLGASVLTFRENEASEFIFDDANERLFLWYLMRVRSIPRFKFQAGLAARYLYATIFQFWEQPLVIWVILMLPRQKCSQYTR